MILLMRFKWYILAFLLGVAMTTGTLTCVKRTNETRLNSEIQRLNDEAKILRGEAQESRKEALAYKERGVELQAALEASLVNSAKLKKELDKIKVPEVGVPPTYVADVIVDLNKWGLNPLVGASNTVGRSAFGIRKDETGIIWQWGAQAQRVPSLEFKLAKTNELVTSVTNDKDLAVKLAETKTQEALKWEATADKHMQEANAVNEEVKKLVKLQKSERWKRILYGAGGIAVGALAVKAAR